MLESRQSPFFYPLSLQQVEWDGSILRLAFNTARLMLSQHTIGFLSGTLVVLFTASVLPCLSEILPEPQRAQDQPQIAPDGLSDINITLTGKELAEMDGRFLPDSTER